MLSFSEPLGDHHFSMIPTRSERMIRTPKRNHRSQNKMNPPKRMEPATPAKPTKSTTISPNHVRDQDFSVTSLHGTNDMRSCGTSALGHGADPVLDTSGRPHPSQRATKYPAVDTTAVRVVPQMRSTTATMVGHPVRVERFVMSYVPYATSPRRAPPSTAAAPTPSRQPEARRARVRRRRTRGRRAARRRDLASHASCFRAACGRSCRPSWTARRNPCRGTRRVRSRTGRAA